MQLDETATKEKLNELVVSYSDFGRITPKITRCTPFSESKTAIGTRVDFSRLAMKRSTVSSVSCVTPA